MPDNTSKAWVGSLVAGLVVIVGLQWEEFFRALQLFPDVVTGWVTKLPSQSLAAALAFVVASAAWAMAFLHPAIMPKKPQSGADLSAVLVALLVSMSMCWAFEQSSPRAVLMFFWFGFFAGCAAAIVARLTWSTFAKPKDLQP